MLMRKQKQVIFLKDSFIFPVSLSEWGNAPQPRQRTAPYLRLDKYELSFLL